MDEVLFGRVVDEPLDECGERQAAALAARMAHESNLLDQASPQRRTRQTARTIAATTGAGLSIAPELDEIDFGRWSGQPFSLLASDPSWQQWNERHDGSCTPAGDSIEQVQSRIVGHLLGLERVFPGRTIALVTHAEVIRSAFLWILGLPPCAYRRFEIGPCSVSTVRSKDGAFTIQCIERGIQV